MADASVQPTTFTRATQRRHTAIRVIAYSCATLFMIVMVLRGVALTEAQIQHDAQRAVDVATAALNAAGPEQVADVLSAISATGLSLRLETAADPAVQAQTVTLADGRTRLIAAIDPEAIRAAAWRANLGYILFVAALGLPTIAIFLYMGWAVNGPALKLLAFAQAGPNDTQPTPALPRIWTSVLARLRQLKESQTQMQAFLDNAPIGMMFRNAAGRLVMINRYGASFYDLSPEALAAKPISFFSAYFPDAEKLARPLFMGPLAGESTTVETEFHGPSGERMHLLIKSFPVRDEKGKVEMVGTFFVDVTDERRARDALRDAQAQMQAFFDNLPGLAFVSNAEGVIVSANSYFADHLGIDSMRAENLVGKLGRGLLPRTWSADAARAIEANEADGKPFRFENTIKTPEGVRYLSATRFPIRDKDGVITHVGGLIFDRTAEKLATDEIVAARESLHQTEKLAALGQLLAGVSHELNNPLAAVIGQASLLAEDLEGSEHAERVGKIRRAADRCARIVQSFLALARQRPPEYRTVALDDLVRQAVELTEYQMRSAGVQVFIGLDPALPPIQADPDQLHQVLVNLLTNARQALEGVEGERRIGISAALIGDQVQLRVIDNGKGIPPEARGRIFDPFFTSKDVGAGTGIGLSFSLGIVEAHGGKLVLEDSEIGAAFAITIPASKAGAAFEAEKDRDATNAKGRVLVIDDEVDIAETLKDMLKRMGLNVTVAIGGRAGLAALDGKTRYDLVLSDIRMPEIDGPALHAWITANRPELLGALAFVTGDTLGREVAAFLTSVECPVLEKPFTRASLEALVERTMAA